MLRTIATITVGLLLGGFAGAYLTYDAYVTGPDRRVSVFQVKELASHQSYADPDAYSDTRLVVYLNGAAGDEAVVLCQFLPGTFDPSHVPAAVKVGPVSKKLGFGTRGYVCSVAE